MGICSFCGKNAGVWRTEHAECAQRHERGKDSIMRLMANAGIDQDTNFLSCEKR